jgi:ribonuclease Y
MFDVLKTLSSLVKVKKGRTTVAAPRDVKVQTPIKQEDVKKVQPPAPVVPQIKEERAPQFEKLQIEAKAELALAQAKAKEILYEAKDEVLKIRRDAEDEVRKKYEALDRKDGALSEREKLLLEKELSIQKHLVDGEKLKQDWFDKLEKIAHLTSEEAKQIILKQVKEKEAGMIARQIKEAEIKAKEEADDKAREILVDAMRHGATDYVAEYTVSTIKITDEDMKGRIIGKEGRNIRAFETATGVDVDLDEEGVIRLSCFDPVRREIARVCLERLLKDGRVQPGRIEDVVNEVKNELDRIMFEEGQKLCHAVGVYNLPSPIVALLGRFKYRFSYGQNMIAHTMEETKIGIAIAKEVGADANVVRLGCLLHDIGKVITDKEGSHVELGVEFLKKYGLPTRVIDCVGQHHEDTPFSSIESIITYIADAISGGRPGARYENYDEYVKRLKSLEEIAKSHEGVKESFAFQAGRELRVIVDPGQMADAAAVVLAQELKEEIEQKVTFPGQIKITVVREVRAIQTAK